jgi:hypothetical protein
MCQSFFTLNFYCTVFIKGEKKVGEKERLVGDEELLPKAVEAVVQYLVRLQCLLVRKVLLHFSNA